MSINPEPKHFDRKLDSRDSMERGILESMPRRYQNGKLQTRTDIARPYYFVRVTKPVIDERTGARVKKRVDEKLGFTDEITRDQAMKYRTQKLDEVNSHQALAPSLVRFSQLAERYLSTRATAHASSTRAWETTQITNHIVPAFGVMKLSEIDRLAVEQWLAAKSGLSWWTKDGLRRLLGRIFTAAEEWGWFEGKKPTLGIRLGRKTLLYKKRLLTIQEFRLLLGALDEEVRFVVLILFGLGLRISEALALRWSDVDWDAQAIKLDRRWHRGDMSEHMKSEGSAAVMRLSPSLLAEFARRRGKPDDPLFPGENGNPYDDRDLGRERLRPVLKRLGLYTRGNLWHQFRRMYNTYLQQAGATPMEAQKAMRHASLDMTYLYTLTDAQREVSQQQAMFDKLMDGGTKQ